jgi:glycosyl hydrolase family 9/cellulase-like Ig domain-containing protein
MKTLRILLLAVIACVAPKSNAEPVIYINQVAFNSNAPKIAVISTDSKLDKNAAFTIIDAASAKVEFSGKLNDAEQIADWAPGKVFYQADFSAVRTKGNYKLRLVVGGKPYLSDAFVIGDNALADLTIPAVIHYYHKQRANKPEEVAADSHIILYGSNNTVDLRGGWCDASGDVSKYFSHLAYANFMSPQQIPLVTWSLVNTSESKQHLLTKLGVKDSIDSESIWGADFILRSLSKEGYFYETIFSYFSKNPNDRRVVGLRANSVTTDAFQAAFREGGGMAIAALARISRWKKNGDFTSQQYLDGAKRAFAHLLVNNTKYDDDGKENIIDDYCALMAATELWIATDSSLYRDEARKRAHNLEKRISPGGYFIADDGSRPFWHASDAGLPVVALCRYLKKEDDQAQREAALNTVKTALLYTLRVTNDVSNPFGYARQTFRFKNEIKEGFFIPHDNETGWWWQGENARLGSLATAAIEGSKALFPAGNNTKMKDSLATFASQQLSWILGCNPYNMCFMYQFGQKNVPYMHSLFGHGSEKGGISNGITGKDGNPDGSGIDFKTEAEGNEWRWTEQWLPHAAWFLAAVTAASGD